MTVKGQPPNRAALKKHLKSLECVPALPHFVPKKRGRKSRRGKATTDGLCYRYTHNNSYIHACLKTYHVCILNHVGIMIGNVLHRHRPTKMLQSGPSTRRGRPIPLRSRCVSCYALAPVPTSASKRKTKMQDGKSIPNVTYACDICRCVLCKNCFWNVYDHRKGGKPCDMVIVLWVV